mmetsp:Transcript_94894/g.164731  ORF Transcript_94894/g.164731 Transcript_94894/m.164731 type:complete len:215 (+) Transcript_94894:48-692(+)
MHCAGELYIGCAVRHRQCQHAPRPRRGDARVAGGSCTPAVPSKLFHRRNRSRSLNLSLSHCRCHCPSRSQQPWPWPCPWLSATVFWSSRRTLNFWISARPLWSCRTRGFSGFWRSLSSLSENPTRIQRRSPLHYHCPHQSFSSSPVPLCSLKMILQPGRSWSFLGFSSPIFAKLRESPSCQQLPSSFHLLNRLPSRYPNCFLAQRKQPSSRRKT